MSIRRIFSTLAAAGLVATGTPAVAFVVPSPPGSVQALMDCFDERLFSAQSANVPPAIAASFRGQGAKLAFRTCRDADRNIHYYLREPRPNRNGVCRTFEKEVFLGSASDRVLVHLLYDSNAPNWYFMLSGWSSLQPPKWTAMRYPARSQVLGFIAESDCPPGDDPRYMPLGNVTDGTLRSFQQMWERISASPEILQAALERLPVSRVTGIERFDTPERKRAFKERTITRVLKEKPQLQGMTCHEGGCAAWFDYWTVEFDVGPNGIVLTGLRAVMST